MSFAGTPSPQEAIEDLRQKVNELTGLVCGLMAYVAGMPNASDINPDATLKIARSLTEKHVFDLRGRQVNVSQEAIQAVVRVLDLARASKAG